MSNELHPWRDDDHPETKVFYACCSNETCRWEEDEYRSEQEDCPSECPQCGADTTIIEEWQGA